MNSTQIGVSYLTLTML